MDSYFDTTASWLRSILFWTKTVAISPTSFSTYNHVKEGLNVSKFEGFKFRKTNMHATFSFHERTAANDTLSVVEKAITQAWAPERNQKLYIYFILFT